MILSPQEQAEIEKTIFQEIENYLSRPEVKPVWDHLTRCFMRFGYCSHVNNEIGGGVIPKFIVSKVLKTLKQYGLITVSYTIENNNPVRRIVPNTGVKSVKGGLHGKTNFNK